MNPLFPRSKILYTLPHLSHTHTHTPLFSSYFQVLVQLSFLWDVFSASQRLGRCITYYSTEQTPVQLVVYFTVFFLSNTVRNLRTRTGSFLFRPASMDRETDLA